MTGLGPGLPRRRLDGAAGSLPWIVACSALTAARIWLVEAQWLVAIWPSPADDALFVSLGRSIADGRWLGTLDAYTLAKGPVYPAWLALVHLSGIRLLVAQAFLYALAAVVLVVALGPILGAPWRRAALYVAVLFNPASWADGAATRVSREGIYASLTLLLLSLAAGAVLRVDRSVRRAAAWAALAGLVGALVVMTREEGVWLLPSIGLLAALGAIRSWARGWRTVAGPAAAAAIAYAAPTGLVMGLNWRFYGLAETCEMRAPYFKAAYGALTRVRGSTRDPLLPVPRETRARISEASPAFRGVSAALERDAEAWSTHSCRTMNVCGDIGGGWFLWALRGAVGDSGKYRSGTEARRWYEQMTEEIDAACSDGRLECLPPRKSLAPPWHASYLRPFLLRTGQALAYVVRFDDVRARPAASYGGPKALEAFGDLTNEEVPRVRIEMEGEVDAGGQKIDLAILDARGVRHTVQVRELIGRDAETDATKPSAARRIEFETMCSMKCALVLHTPDRKAVVVAIEEDAGNAKMDGLTWRTVRVARVPVVEDGSRSRAARLAILDAVTLAYRWLLPVLVAIALATVGVRLRSGWRARVLPLVTLISLSFLVAVLVRALLIAVVDATSFPAVNVTYLSPAHALLVAFVGLVLLADADQAPPAVPARRPDGEQEPLADSHGESLAPWRRGPSG